MPEPVLNPEVEESLKNLEASLLEVFKVDNKESLPSDMQSLLSLLDGSEFCREIILDQAEQRIARLLSNTSNQFLQ